MAAKRDAGKTTADGPGGLKTIVRIQRSTEVRNQLEAAIRRGDFAPGSKIPSERELVETFGVSRVSVREAIRSLEALGQVTVQHGRGVFVNDRRSGVGEPMARWLDLHRDETVELIDVRAALDATAVEKAVFRYREAEIEAIERAHDAFREAVESNASADELVRLDGEFHLAIAEASGNRLLYDLLVDLNAYLSSHRHVALAADGRAHRSLREHDRVVEAILERDGERARTAMTEHLASVREYFLAGSTKA
jgi:GntR family transcriptional regulator, transcriptional repressor for pyruvate dehydrogenase complex